METVIPIAEAMDPVSVTPMEHFDHCCRLLGRVRQFPFEFDHTFLETSRPSVVRFLMDMSSISAV